MIIALKRDPQKQYVAYGIYWVIQDERYLRTYAVVESQDRFPGFSYFDESQVDIIDTDLGDYVFVESYFEGDSRFQKELIAHRAAYSSEDFYSALCEHEDYANIQQLLQNMRDMGLNPTP